MSQRFVTIATRNPHKTREIQEILGPEFVIRDLSQIKGIPDIAETGSSFEENAALKAIAVSGRVPGLIVADDSGLEVDALHGAPGIFSARYAGEPANDRKNLDKLLRDLAQCVQDQRRQARFRCVLAVARDGKLLKTFTGDVEGKIAKQPRGHGGFGYDPIFVPGGYDHTFAELSIATKNRISHRRRAVEAAAPFLKEAVGR